jgi:hypothetical protein
MVWSKGRQVLPARMLRRLNTVILVFLLSCLASSSAFAACHAVTPGGTGSKTGADWNNAYAGLPGTLTRGDVYYVADGTYAANYTFSTPDSGTTLSTIRKAQPSDHCTDTGWNTGTMGSSQAIFPRLFSVGTDYLLVDGNGSQSAPGCGGAPGSTVTSGPPSPADCGIKLDGSSCSGGTNSCNGVVFFSNTSGVSHYTFRYVELEGNGDNNSDQMEVFNPYGGTDSNWSHVYGHNAGCVYFQDGLDGRTASFSYFWGTEVNGPTGGCHGQYMFDAGADSNGTEHDNVYRDITGTAIWTFANSSTTHNNWKFYNNVIWFSSPVASWSPYLSDGLIACINAGTNCTNFTLMQNSIINVPTKSTSGINNENTGSYTVENNLWYTVGFVTAFNAGTGGTFTQDHNSFLNDAGCPSGTGNVCDGSYASQTAPNPFSNWAAGDFTLASENSDWNNRVDLGAPYTVDPDGTTRTTDKSTYQFTKGGQPPNPPTNLTDVVN